MPEFHPSGDVSASAPVTASSPSATDPTPANAPPPATLAIVPQATIAAPIPAKSTSSAMAQATPQYRYQSVAEDQHLISELWSWLMKGKLGQTTPAHILAASPTICKDLLDKLHVHQVETSSFA